MGEIYNPLRLFRLCNECGSGGWGGLTGNGLESTQIADSPGFSWRTLPEGIRAQGVLQWLA